MLYFLFYFIIAGIVAHFLHKYLESSLDNKNLLQLSDTYFKYDADTRLGICIIVSWFWVLVAVFCASWLVTNYTKILLGKL